MGLHLCCKILMLDTADRDGCIVRKEIGSVKGTDVLHRGMVPLQRDAIRGTSPAERIKDYPVPEQGLLPRAKEI